MGAKYYSLLDGIGKFINEHEIDISSVNKSTINKINEYCRIRSLTEACFSKPEDDDVLCTRLCRDGYEENNETSDEDNELYDEYEENNETNNNYEENNETNDSYEDDYINKLRNVLLKAIKYNDRELMIFTMNYLNTLESNKKNNQENDANTVANKKTT